ncbi:preprotein translocase subunit SecG [Ottowia sp.]|uniref:preprotein translocase subunit SecG n=1 Tax=Ottowia sp. TaxID=1898956 RepID=UPI003A86C46F
MNLILNLVLVLQIVSALAMVGLILVQHGKGADMGAAFGSGSSGSLFGASGSANFLSRTTAVLATVFLAATLALAYFGFSVRTGSTTGSSSVLDAPAVVAPAADASATAASAPAIAASASAADAIPTGAPAASASLAMGASAAASATPAASATGAAQIPTQ